MTDESNIPSVEESVSDGAATANAFTWEDINSNGIPDEGEPPIPFVTISVGQPDILTASDGWGSPWKFMPGCGENCWEGETVSVKVPPRFEPTTPTNYSLTGDDSNYYFGFHVDNENEVVSFSNEPDWQKAFINRGAKVLVFHYADNGQLEIALDREDTILDDYYHEIFLTDQFYFNIFIFDIILDLKHWHEVFVSEVKITLLPSKSIFSCKISDIDEWDGRISGYEIITEHCEHE